MHKEILINVEPEEKRIAVVENGRLEEFYIERPSLNSIVGNIYKGIVHSVVPGINAAFINIGFSKDGFLYLSDMTEPPKEIEDEVTFERPLFSEFSDPVSERPGLKIKGLKIKSIDKVLKKGEEVLVQVVKEGLGTKGPRLTTHITLPGRHLVLMPVDIHLGISKRIEDPAERIRLKEILKKLSLNYTFGIIVRTAAVGKREWDFRKELRFLANLWKGINLKAKRHIAPCLIHEEYYLIQRILRDVLTEEFDRVIVDQVDEFKRMRGFVRAIFPNLLSKISLYRGKSALFESKSIEKDIGQLFERKVHLKCGGSIVIEQTEGMVAIDVNSGHFRKERPEETAFWVNQEAAVEIARQIRLRDLGGIIIIDFIDMQKAEYRREIYDTLVEAFKRDKAKLDISKISEFGIVELTRQRTRQDIIGITHQRCPYCSGRGFVKSEKTMAISVLRSIRSELEAGLAKAQAKTLRVLVEPGVAQYLLNENRSTISFLEGRFRTKIVIVSQPNRHIEDFRIERG